MQPVNPVRDLGVMSWLLVGIAALLVGAIYLLAAVNTIAAPVITAGILAAVLSPVVGLLASCGSPATAITSSSSDHSSANTGS